MSENEMKKGIFTKIRKEWRKAFDNDEFLDGEDVDERIADWWILRILKIISDEEV